MRAWVAFKPSEFPSSVQQLKHLHTLQLHKKNEAPQKMMAYFKLISLSILMIYSGISTLCEHARSRTYT